MRNDKGVAGLHAACGTGNTKTAAARPRKENLVLNWILFGLGCFMMACALSGYACIYVSAQSDPDRMGYEEM